MLNQARFFLGILPILLMTVTVWADSSIQVIKNGPDLVLSGTDCPSLLDQAKALAAWKTEATPAEAVAALPLECNSVNGSYSVTVTGNTPQWAVDHQNFYSAYDGPNCWATASFMTGMISAVISLDADEFTFHISSPQCIEKSYDQREPGDVVVIRTQNPQSPLGFDEVHGFIYLTDALAFSKNGKFRSSPFAIQDYQGVLSTYGVTIPCAQNPIAQGCDSYAKIFHCEGSTPIPSRLQAGDLQKYNLFTTQLAKLSNLVMNGLAAPQDLADIKTLFSTLADTSTYVQALQTQAKTSADGSLDFWTQFYTQILSVQKQQGMMDLPNPQLNAGRLMSQRPLIFSSQN